jgi:hypothetical protein
VTNLPGTHVDPEVPVADWGYAATSAKTLNPRIVDDAERAVGLADFKARVAELQRNEGAMTSFHAPSGQADDRSEGVVKSLNHPRV